jgi:HlyD family secretion protein
MATMIKQDPKTISRKDQNESPKGNISRRDTVLYALSGLGFILALIAVGHFVHQRFFAQAQNPCIWISGRIEEAESHISAAVPAQVRRVTVDEGDPVRKGQLLILLDDHSLQTKLNDAGSAISAAQTAQVQARRNINGLKTEAQAVRSQPVGIMTKLFGGLVGRKKQQMEKEMEFRMKMAQAEGQASGARAEAIKARAARDEVSSNLSYFRINSPIDGICATKSVEEGEMAAPGRILLTLVNPADAYLRGFVAEGDIASIKIGERANVFLDSAPKQALAAKVVAIDPEAAFTPENIYFKQDRVKQVFGIKLKIEQSDGIAKPGMPADAQIFLAQTGQSTR